MRRTLIFLLLFVVGCDFAFWTVDMFGPSQGLSWQEKAIINEDPGLCEKASYPDTCRIGYAKEMKDDRVCDSIKDQDALKQCYAVANS